MGQYYYAVCLEAGEYAKGSMLKLTETSYVGNPFVETVVHRLRLGGEWSGKPIVWAGDYMEEFECFDPETEKRLRDEVEAGAWPRDHGRPTLHTYAAMRLKLVENRSLKHTRPFLVNIDKGEYVSVNRCPIDDWGFIMHPLPILTASGNGQGGGDYYPKNEREEALVGSWANHRIVSMTASQFEKFRAGEQKNCPAANRLLEIKQMTGITIEQKQAMVKEVIDGIGKADAPYPQRLKEMIPGFTNSTKAEASRVDVKGRVLVA